MIAYQQGRIIKHKTRSESLQKRLLENMLPSCIVDELRKKNYTINSWDELKSLSKRHLSVSIMFADIVGFTHFSSEVDPSRVMVFLNDLFFEFDNLCEDYNVYKVETVGDCYVAAGKAKRIGRSVKPFLALFF
jgi:class 3 adenylate cyclase